MWMYIVTNKTHNEYGRHNTRCYVWDGGRNLTWHWCPLVMLWQRTRCTKCCLRFRPPANAITYIVCHFIWCCFGNKMLTTLIYRSTRAKMPPSDVTTSTAPRYQPQWCFFSFCWIWQIAESGGWSVFTWSPNVSFFFCKTAQSLQYTRTAHTSSRWCHLLVTHPPSVKKIQCRSESWCTEIPQW